MLTKPIVGGQGQIRVDDTIRRVEGPDLPSGTKMRVVGADGPVLILEPAE